MSQVVLLVLEKKFYDLIFAGVVKLVIKLEVNVVSIIEKNTIDGVQGTHTVIYISCYGDGLNFRVLQT